MIFSLCIALAAAAAKLVAGQFTIKYFTSGSCNGFKLGCSNIPAYDCCDAPPSPGSFHSIRATTGGQFGIVIFTYPTGGGCGGCQFGGVFNQCYKNNNPFNTAFIATFTQCGSAASVERRALDGFMEKQPFSHAAGSAPSECRNTRQVDTATVNGQHYDVTGPEREVIIADMLSLTEDEFAAKWAKVLRTPASIEALGLEAS